MEDIEAAHVCPVDARRIGDGLIEAGGGALRTPDLVQQSLEYLSLMS
jgi:hypothetical protein